MGAFPVFRRVIRVVPDYYRIKVRSLGIVTARSDIAV